jgi:hypothetical protein
MRVLQPAVDHVASVELAVCDPDLSSPGHRVPQGAAVLQVVPSADDADRDEHRDAERGESPAEDPDRTQP